MQWKQSKIEEILKNHLIINSNSDTFYNCYYKCADKKKIKKLYNERNHEIIFGRRGTGKTTLFKSLYYYTNFVEFSDLTVKCIYIDMEDVIPNEINNDDQKAIIIETYRKFLRCFFDQLLEFWDNLNSTNTYYNITYTNEEIGTISKKLDVLYDLIQYGEEKPVINKGIAKTNETVEKAGKSSLETKFGIETLNKIINNFPKITFEKHKKNTQIKDISIEREFIYTLDIYSIKKVLDDVIEAFKLDRLIICIDEFTRVDKGLQETIQPYLAQLIKDTFFRNPNISVKVSSLWNKTHIQKRQLDGVRIGIELGEDIKRSLDLDTMFFENEHSYSFFKNMIMNTCLLCAQDGEDGSAINDKDLQNFREYLIDLLFLNDEAFKLMICGSQGVPRIFGNLLLSAIDKRKERKDDKIDSQIVYNCIIENANRDVRRKLNYSHPIVCSFDDFITTKKTRFILVSIEDYEKYRQEIDGLLNNNYMHQYPSERVPRLLRNRYKLYLVHLGNYLESLGIKDWRKNISEYTILYPQIPKELEVCPQEYLWKYNV